MKIDRITPATYEEISNQQKCPLCRDKVDLAWHTWVKMDGKITHDYCVRTKLGSR